jgi:hypothetical protein
MPRRAEDFDEEEDFEDDEYDLSDVVDEALEHPRVRRVFDMLTETLDRAGQLIDKVSRGSIPKHAPPAQPQAQKKLLNPYLVLGFNPHQPLTEDMIKTRRRRLAEIYHPDKPGGDVEAMKMVTAAADMLLKKLKTE